MILASVVSSPTLVTLNLKVLGPLTVEPITASPILLFTGRLSPVIIASLIDASPSMITPSEASLSPGLTKTTSSISSSSMLMVFSSPSLITVTSSTFRLCNLSTASLVLAFAFASISLPNKTKVIITADDSKYRCGLSMNIL